MNNIYILPSSHFTSNLKNLPFSIPHWDCWVVIVVVQKTRSKLVRPSWKWNISFDFELIYIGGNKWQQLTQFCASQMTQKTKPKLLLLPTMSLKKRRKQFFSSPLKTDRLRENCSFGVSSWCWYTVCQGMWPL